MPLSLDWKPHRIFYGWWVVIACFFISLCTGGIVFYGFTTLFEPLASQFGWSYTQISFAASLRGLETGLLAPFVGILVDRWGPRRLLFAGLAITGLGLILLSRIASLGMLYGASILLAVGISACSSTVLMTAVGNWFHRKIGIATGIMVSGYGLGGLLVPLIVWLIGVYDWRMAIVILAAGLLAVCLPLSRVVRDRPEQYGLLPDGEAENTVTLNNGPHQEKFVEVNIGTRQAVKSRTFWHLTLALALQAMIVSSVVTHIMPYLATIHIPRAKSSLIASILPLISIGGRLGLGWLGDRFDKRRLIAAAFAMMFGGLLCLGFASSEATWPVIPFLILFGIGFGGNNTLRASGIREFFGRSNFGAIHGFVLGTMALGSIAGPPLAGWVFDRWGSYQPIWLIFAGLAIIAILVAITTPPSQQHKPTGH